MARILVADPIAQEGVQRLIDANHEVDVRTGQKPDELLKTIGDYDALVVRSETQVTADVISAGQRLQVVGRAGVGVDNIDLDAATRRGIAVVNAPTGNTIAAAEHTMALMLALVRNIPQSDASMRKGEWKRSAFVGVEVRNKTLGIIGLGKVGSEVARRARAFEMRLVGYDPYVPQEYARNLGVALADLPKLIAESDIITIHTPLTDSTKALLGKEQFAMMKPGVRIINVARGGLVDEALLEEALQSGKVAGAALDVFSSEPPGDLTVVQNPKAVVTPHLGASTAEAQVEVAIQIADQVLAILESKPALHTVNAPYIPQEVHEVLAPYIPVATILGKIGIQLAEGQLESVTLTVSGSIAEYDTSLLNSAALMGLLADSTEERVNLVNAPVLARQRGLKVVEQKDVSGDHHTNLVSVEVHSGGGSVTVAGTTMRGEPHLVQVDDYNMDVALLSPYMLFTTHVDQPGMIGRVGTLTGEHDINISFMEVGRVAPRKEALMVVGLDDALPPKVRDLIANAPGVTSAIVVRI